MYRKDMLTGERFIPKRRNQKFESANNRIHFNNQKSADIKMKKSYIDKPLSDN